MPKALIIAYDYPPRGWSGVQRTVKFVRYLPEFGWQPIVLAPKAWYGPVPMDPSHLDEVAHAITVRAGDLTPEALGRFWTRVGRRLGPLLKLLGKDARWLADGMAWRQEGWFFPDAACTWIPSAVRAALRMVRAHRPDILYATAPPYSTLLTGLLVSRLTRVPLVVDFRDLWLDKFGRKAVSKRRQWAETHLERRVLRDASAVLATTRSATRILRAKCPADQAHKFVTIYNGYDPSDLPPPPGRHQGQGELMTVCHVGSLYNRQTPAGFLRALEQLARESHPHRLRMRARFVGQVHEFHDLFRNTTCADLVELTGPVNHAEATRHLMSADLLLLILGEGGEAVIPGKLFEYLASGKPILSLVPLGGEAATLLRRAGATRLVDVRDSQGASRALGEFYQQWLHGGVEGRRDEPFVRSFNRRQLTARLATVFDCVCGMSAAVPPGGADRAPGEASGQHGS